MPSFNDYTNDRTCTRCGEEVRDEALRGRYYQEEFPEIIYGPFCRDCLPYIRVCNGCEKAFDTEDMKYFNNGQWYCEECQESIETCDVCGGIHTIHKTVDGMKYCEGCYSREFYRCPVCEEDHHIDDSISPMQQAQYRGVVRKFGKQVCLSCFNDIKSRFKKYDVRKCTHCGRFHSDTTSKSYCDSCYNSFPICSSCGKRHPKVNSYPFDGRYRDLCLSCYRTKYSKCDKCGSVVLKKDASNISNGIVSKCICNKCSLQDCSLSICDRCQRVVPVGDDGICADCSTMYSTCSCGSVKCPSIGCRSCNNENARNIYNYTYSPPLLQFHHTKSDIKEEKVIFFGIENEVSYKDGYREALKNIYKHYQGDLVYAKSDGTIDGYGFEVVTHPMTLSFLNKLELSPMFADKPYDTPSNGMHIHVARTAFSNDSHVFKIIEFIHTNSSFCDEVAGRSYNQYNRKYDDKISEVVLKKKKTNSTPIGKYARVNLSPEHTIEFRMFATCINEYMFRYRVEFLHALVLWTDTVGYADAKSIELFKKFLKGKKEYYNINKFLKN